ncbi:MAG: type VI secretion system protein TssA [Betaproteobacteria bacterium]|nr:type VI secretion system protein TssA [Betaproteobacteria bacterium]
MLTPNLVDVLLAPVREDAPCGDNLEYDPAFTALETASQGKPEQQFGKTVITAVEPEWGAVAEQAQALLQRTKDLRPALLLVRAVAHEQGLEGLLLGLQLLTGLLDRYWEQLHPRLDDDNDPTMRMNILIPLNDPAMFVHDLYSVQVGVSRGMGPVRVREIAASHGMLASGAETPSQAQMLDALAEIQSGQPALAGTLAGLAPALVALQRVISERSGRDGLLDLDRLVPIGGLLAQIGSALGGDESLDAATAGTEGDALADGLMPVGAPRDGGICSRRDALRVLDRVIAYFERAEPGNPAPLLLSRAKQLIGVSFFDIVTNLAPNALDTIETVTGRRPSSE